MVDVAREVKLVNLYLTRWIEGSLGVLQHRPLEVGGPYDVIYVEITLH